MKTRAPNLIAPGPFMKNLLPSISRLTKSLCLFVSPGAKNPLPFVSLYTKRPLPLAPPRAKRLLPLLFLLIGPALPAHAQAVPFTSQETLASLLQKGELTLVESRPDSNLKQVTAITVVKRPIQDVWNLLTNFPGYLKWMPKVAEATVVKKEGASTDVQWEIEVPGPNYRYVSRTTEEKANYILRQKQVSGSLKGSHWTWQLVPQGTNLTLVYRTVYTNVTDESWIARQVDDESHTLDYGINVSSSLVEIRAIRRALEQGR